ncbi:MAG TPA: tRNA (guanosine(37)-N1)-methyltransferase TrmD [bacterium]|nr:tRNA (guanosine(37)-N1)-methyltransferase TrmD [bacterium]
MRFDIITIFPQLFDSFLNASLIKKATDKKISHFKIHNLRDWASDKHKKVDDRPFGGGAGMILKPEPLFKAIKALKSRSKKNKTKVILLAPAGHQFSQPMAKKWLEVDQIILICGRYEGVDARVEKIIDEKISIGPYVLSGGEVAAMVVMEAVVRLVPGYMSNPASLKEETFEQNLYEYPQYTRPESLLADGKEHTVPRVLLSGDHQKIVAWRQRHRRKI